MACAVHEAVGHGGACIATGGQIRMLSSVYFHCTPGSSIVDAAGPFMNLCVALACVAALLITGLPPLERVLVALLVAFNGFWGSGYFVFSALANTGDWALVIRDLSLQPVWLWRAGMAVLGVGLYLFTIRATAPHLPRGKPLVAAYLAAGFVACASAIFYRGPTLPAMQQAAQESLLASIGLVFLALRRTPPSETLSRAVEVPYSRIALALSMVVVVVFWLTLRRGTNSC